MKNILIPTDFSENAWNAIRYAFELFRHKDCNFYLIHVANLREYPVEHFLIFPPIGTAKETSELSSKKRLELLLDKVKKRYPEKKSKVFRIHDYGYFIDALRRNINEKKIDLIVMGTRGANGLKQLTIGSNTADVITKLRCNTMAIPQGVRFSQPDKIAFPTDYNIFYSDPILRTLNTLLSLTEAKIKIVHVSRKEVPLSSEQEENKQVLQEYLAELFPKKYDFETVEGQMVTKAINEVVKKDEADIIVMVAKNLNFMQQIFFDSTIKQLSFQTTVPLLVIHG